MGYIYEDMDNAKDAIQAVLQGITKNMAPYGISLISNGTIYFIGLYMQLPTFLIQHTNSAQILRLMKRCRVASMMLIERMAPNATIETVVICEIEIYKKALRDLFSRDLCRKNRIALMPGKNM